MTRTERNDLEREPARGDSLRSFLLCMMDCSVRLLSTPTQYKLCMNCGCRQALNNRNQGLRKQRHRRLNSSHTEQISMTESGLSRVMGYSGRRIEHAWPATSMSASASFVFAGPLNARPRLDPELKPIRSRRATRSNSLYYQGGPPRDAEDRSLQLQVSSARWRAICAAQDKLDVTRIYSGKYRAVKSSSQHPRRSICVRMQSAQWKNVICRVTIHWATLGKDTTALSPIIRTIFCAAVPLPASNTSSSCR